VIIDIALAAILVVAFYLGFKNGMLNAFFTLLAIMVGTTGAVKLSYHANAILSNQGLESKYLPFISFIIVFTLLVVAVKILGFSVDKLVSKAGLSWANKLAGAVLLMAAGVWAASTGIFYLDNMEFLTDELKSESVSFPLLEEFTPQIIEGVGYVLPFMNDLMDGIKEYFQELKLPENFETNTPN